MKQRHDIRLVIVDYLQLLRNQPRQRQSGQRNFRDQPQSIKTLAKGSVPVIALTQLSRAVESRDDKRPMLSDLRRSGSNQAGCRYGLVRVSARTITSP